MRSPARNLLTFLEPHHRPLVWAGAAAFFGFPLLSSLLTHPPLASALWLLPPIIAVAVAVILNGGRGVTAGRVVAVALALGWFVAGSAAIRLEHAEALRRPVLPAVGASGGVLRGESAGDARRGRGSYTVVPLRLTGLETTTGESLPARGEVTLRLKGGTPVPSGSSVSLH